MRRVLPWPWPWPWPMVRPGGKGGRSWSLLRENLVHDLAVHVRQPIIAALKTEGELLVIEPETMHQRGMQIVHVHFVLGHVKPEFVRLANRDAGPDAASGQPH